MSILIEKLTITIDGVNYGSKYTYSNIKLTQELMKPGELRFHMTKDTLAEDVSDMKIDISRDLLGKEIRFSMTTYRDDENKNDHYDTLNFNGIVFGVRAVRKHMRYGLVLEVTAYTPDYLLMDNAHCNSYENASLSDIATDVVSAYETNIPISVSPVMKEDIPYVVQYNETSYEFLSRLAQRYGEWFYNDGSKLIFGQLEKLDAVDLTPGFDILNYEYKVSMKHSKITHARHNYMDYQNTQASAPESSISSGLHRLTSFASGASDHVYRKTTFRNYHSSLAEESNLDEVEHSARAQTLGKQAGTMKCYGSSYRCDLQIGSVIRIKEYYDPGTGNEEEYVHDELLICGITHYADNNGTYRNDFRAIDPAAEYPPYAFGDCYPHTETQRAVVTDNKDPEHLGRIRVQFLWQQEQDDSQMSPWIRIAQPHGGGDKGFYFIPEVDEEVVVGFENGNAEKPYVIGTLYHGQAKPSGSWYDEEDNIKAIRTRSGHTLEFHDTFGNEYMKIYDNQKDNFVLTFSSVERVIRLQSKGNIELYADNDIIMKAGNNIEVEANADIKSKAGKDIFETAGESNTIDIGKDRTITVANNISEKVGKDFSQTVTDNSTVDIGKDRTITVGNNIQEKAGDNITIDVGKDRTITAGSNISETAGADISLKAESNINESAGSNVKVDAGGDVEASAGKNIGLSASENISSSAGKNMSMNAEDNITESAGKNLIISVEKDSITTISKNMTLSVGKDMQADIDKSLYASVSSKFDIKANEIEQASTGKTRLLAANMEQEADSSMKINGGGSMDIKANNVRIN